jgi:hypothetical protein
MNPMILNTREPASCLLALLSIVTLLAALGRGARR